MITPRSGFEGVRLTGGREHRAAYAGTGRRTLDRNQFTGRWDPDQMLERMIELSLYTEEHLR